MADSSSGSPLACVTSGGAVNLHKIFSLCCVNCCVTVRSRIHQGPSEMASTSGGGGPSAAEEEAQVAEELLLAMEDYSPTVPT